MFFHFLGSNEANRKQEVTVAGGWGQAGGHSPVSASYGLGVDQALEYKVVTADGNLVGAGLPCVALGSIL